MSHHFNLLASVPKPAARTPSLPAATAPITALVLVAAAAGLAAWSQHIRAGLAAQLSQATQAPAALDAGSPARLDAKVIAALSERTDQRETLAAALLSKPTPDSAEAAAESRASAWLEALDQTTPSGLALNQVHIEPGARLTLVGAALSSNEINTLIEKLQLHPLTGRAPVGQLDIRRADARKEGSRDGGAAVLPGASGLYFSITPPSPAAATRAPTP